MSANVNLPTVAERLKELEPTKDVLDFYRNRLAAIENDDGKIMNRLTEFKLVCETQYSLEKDLLNRDEEIMCLRKALSDMQGSLYQEREHVLRVYSENDRLKIRELEDRKMIQQLLTLCQDKFPLEDIHYIMKDYSQDIPLPNKTLKRASSQQVLNKTKNRMASNDGFDNTEVFKLQIEALKAELEEQTKFARDNIEALTEDLRVTREESEAQYFKHTQRIDMLSNKLKLSQDLLVKMTEDNLDLKRVQKKQEQSWLAQRDEMGLHIRTLKRIASKDKVNAPSSYAPSTVMPPMFRSMPRSVPHSVNNDMKCLQQNLDRVSKMSETYKNQCLKLEDELAQLREEKDSSKTLYNERSEKLSTQLKSISGKYKDLEKRHKLEVEGFKNDVKILKNHLQKVEKQLLKTAIQLTQTQVDQDMLQTIHNTTTKSKYLSDNIRAMKAQIVQLEQDLRLV